jgi:methionyl-tRNA formyltransferase
LSVRIVFLGMVGTLSAIPLEQLLVAGADVRAIIVPTTVPGLPLHALPRVSVLSGTIPLLPARGFPSRARQCGGLETSRLPAQADVLEIARERHLPVWAVSDLRHPDSLTRLRGLQPELLIVSCFRYILPGSWLAVPAHGAWNMHPSLLPRLRGPDPLYWTFHENAQPGVSVHRMSARVDAGPILAQALLQFPDGISYAEAERHCAEAGGGLCVDALRALAKGTLASVPQVEADAAFFPLPSGADFIVTADWKVRHAFNFMRGAAALGEPVLRVAGHDFRVREAVGYTEGEEIAEAYSTSGAELRARLADGVLRVIYSRPEPLG